MTKIQVLGTEGNVKDIDLDKCFKFLTQIGGTSAFAIGLRTIHIKSRLK